jgi:hypothetical protein
MALQPLERRVYIGFGVSGACLGVVTALAYLSHAKWADAWIPSLISGWSGIFIAVAVIDRLQAVDRERKATEDRARVNLIAAHNLASCVEPVAYYVGALIGSGDAKGYQPARFNSITVTDLPDALVLATEPWRDPEYGVSPDIKQWRSVATRAALEAANRASAWLRDWQSSVQRATGSSDVVCALELQKANEHLSEIGRHYEPRQGVEYYDPWDSGHSVLAMAVRQFHAAMDELLGPEADRGNIKALLSLDNGFREFSADVRYRQYIDEAVPGTDERSG